MGGWVFLAIFITLALVSAISHVLKGKEEPPRRRPPREDYERGERVVHTATPSEKDRFLAEIERLRKKPAGPAMKAVPVVKPKRSNRMEDLPAAEVKPATKIVDRRPETTTPTANVAAIAVPKTVATIAVPKAVATPVQKIATLTKSKSDSVETRFSRDLLGMLKTKDALPMAVVLQEILGEPKSRRRG